MQALNNRHIDTSSAFEQRVAFIGLKKSFAQTSQISHAWRAWVPPLLKYGGMFSGDIIADSGESKGVATVAIS